MNNISQLNQMLIDRRINGTTINNTQNAWRKWIKLCIPDLQVINSVIITQ